MTSLHSLARGRLGTCFSLLFCVGTGIAFCFDALTAPLFGGQETDILSNLLPIVHYRYSVLEEGSFPSYTTLWYGGRAQWQNPLWNFFYLPATLTWLAFGLKLGTDIVICAHVILMLMTGWYLCSLFLKNSLLSCMGAILLAAPMATALRAGHIENIVAYPWILLGTRFLLDQTRSTWQRGGVGGLCLGVAALAGANYYVLYAGILYLLLIILQPERLRLAAGLAIGSLVGLPHVISVVHLIGVPRGIPTWSIPTYSEASFLGMINDLFLGMNASENWGFMALVGVGSLPLFLVSVWDLGRAVKLRGVRANGPAFAPLLALGAFVLLGSGLAYRGHHLLDTFRVPARALTFAALALLLFVFLSAQNWNSRRRVFLTSMMLFSVAHIAIVLPGLRPVGSRWDLDNSGAKDLAAYLQDQGARSVWLQTPDGNMLIHLALNQYGIGVPNAYYGDMGQHVRSAGKYCGFSFDHILLQGDQLPASIEFRSNVPARPVEGPSAIDSEQIEYLREFSVGEETWRVYRVICPNAQDPPHQSYLADPLQQPAWNLHWLEVLSRSICSYQQVAASDHRTHGGNRRPAGPARLRTDPARSEDIVKVGRPCHRALGLPAHPIPFHRSANPPTDGTLGLSDYISRK